jgi:hypothetical protein
MSSLLGMIAKPNVWEPGGTYQQSAAGWLFFSLLVVENWLPFCLLNWPEYVIVHPPCTSTFQPVLQIHEILCAEPWLIDQWPSRCKKKIFSQRFFCLLLFEGPFTSFFKEKKSKEVCIFFLKVTGRLVIWTFGNWTFTVVIWRFGSLDLW